MALTTTPVLAAVSMGAAAAEGSNLVITAAQASTVRARLTGFIDNGAAQGNNQKRVRLYYAVSATGAQTVAQVRQIAKWLDLIQAPTPAGRAHFESPIFDTFGGFIYTWTDVPLMENSLAVVVTASLVECPV